MMKKRKNIGMWISFTIVGGGMCHFDGMCIIYMLGICLVGNVLFSIVPYVSSLSKFEGL